MFHPNKYKAKKIEIDGITFHSLAEGKRYRQLKMLMQMGHIKDLELQPEYTITIEGIKICKVILDFRYVLTATNKTIIEDVKGMDNPLSSLKRKLVEALFKIKVTLC